MPDLIRSIELYKSLEGEIILDEAGIKTEELKLETEKSQLADRHRALENKRRTLASLESLAKQEIIPIIEQRLQALEQTYVSQKQALEQAKQVLQERGLEEDVINSLSDLEIIQALALIPDPEYSILLEPGTAYNPYNHPLHFSMHRLGINSEVEKAANSLGLKLGNPAYGLDKTPFIGNVTNQQALDLLSRLDCFTSVRIVVGYSRLLLDGIDGKIEVFNGLGKKLDTPMLEKAFDERFKTVNPLRGEHLGNSFSKKDDCKIYTSYPKVTNDGLIQIATEPLDEDCLMEDRTPGIYLKYWLRNHTPQGFPSKKTLNGESHNYHPRDNSVARLYVCSDGALLLCHGGARLSRSWLGVGVARVIKK